MPAVHRALAQVRGKFGTYVPARYRCAKQELSAREKVCREGFSGRGFQVRIDAGDS